jgi:hypothetical protein
MAGGMGDQQLRLPLFLLFGGLLLPTVLGSAIPRPSGETDGLQAGAVASWISRPGEDSSSTQSPQPDQHTHHLKGDGQACDAADVPCQAVQDQGGEARSLERLLETTDRSRAPLP